MAHSLLPDTDAHTPGLICSRQPPRHSCPSLTLLCAPCCFPLNFKHRTSSLFLDQTMARPHGLGQRSASLQAPDRGMGPASRRQERVTRYLLLPLLTSALHSNEAGKKPGTDAESDQHCWLNKGAPCRFKFSREQFKPKRCQGDQCQRALSTWHKWQKRQFSEQIFTAAAGGGGGGCRFESKLNI